MFNSIPKINVGSSVSKKNLFDLSRDVTTSARIGECQPLMVRELLPNTDITLDVKNFVRLAPLAQPTFGRMKYKTFCSFIPTSDLFEPFENFMAEQPYNNGSSSYIPVSVPSISVDRLTQLFLRIFCDHRVATISATSDGNYNYTWKSFSDAATLCDGVSDLSMKRQLYVYTNSSYCANNYNTDITFDSADFVYYFQSGTTKFLICSKCRDFTARSFRKLLIGCGFQFDITNSVDKVSLLPFFAYYKAWYDLFFVQRDSTWADTRVAQYLRNCANNPQQVVVDSFTQSTFYTFENLFKEISVTYYTYNPDFISSHISTTSSAQITRSTVSSDGGNTISVVRPTDAGAERVTTMSGQPFINFGSYLDKVGLELLDVLTKIVNKNTAFGARIDKILQNRYGSKYHHSSESNFVGSSSTDIQIGDIMSTSDTKSGDTGAMLGEYAGKGLGFSSGGSKMSFHTRDKFGYLVVFSCIITDSGFCQGLDPNLLHTTKYDFFAGQEFDALGFQATRRNALFGDLVCTNDYTQDKLLSKTFGFIPRYTEYKVNSNILNGSCSLRSTRDSFIGYTLDRYLRPVDWIAKGSNVVYRSDVPGSSTLTGFNAGTEWRNGSSQGLNNTNRIFVANDIEDDDNFIIHNVIDFKANQPMMSVADSFDTDGLDSNHQSVEKQ